MATSTAPQLPTAATTVWNIGELQMQIIQYIANDEVAITVKQSISNNRYPLKSRSGLALASHETAGHYQAALLKTLLYYDTELCFTIPDLNFSHVKQFFTNLPASALPTLILIANDMWNNRSAQVCRSKIRPSLCFSRSFLDECESESQKSGISESMLEWETYIKSIDDFFLDYICFHVGADDGAGAFGKLFKFLQGSREEELHELITYAEVGELQEERRTDLAANVYNAVNTLSNMGRDWQAGGGLHPYSFSCPCCGRRLESEREDLN